MKKEKKSVGSVFVYIILTIWALTTVYPIIWVILNSFKAKNMILSNSFSLPLGELFTMANYNKAFNNLDILGAYKNSIVISGCVVIGVVLFAGMAAYALSR